MPIEIGQVEAIFRYPVKSMAGERLEAAEMGWHGQLTLGQLAFRDLPSMHVEPPTNDDDQREDHRP